MSRRRSRGGEQRMDAAIDHFAPMGFRKADVRSVVNRLLRDVYGKDGWPFLEDSCYNVVQEALLEMQEEQDKLQLQAVQQPQQHEQEDGDGGDDVGDGGAAADDEEEPQQQEAAMIEPPLENVMPIVMVDSEAQPSETVLAVEQTGEVIRGMLTGEVRPRPASTGAGRTTETVLAVEQTGEVIMDMLTGEVRPRPASTGTGRTRRPCYGWISDSESDSDYEEFLARQQKSAEARRRHEEEVDEIFEQGVAVSAAHAPRQEDWRIAKEEQAKKWIDLVSDSDEDDD